MEEEDIQKQQNETEAAQESSNTEVREANANDGGADETDYRADLDITYRRRI